jgi:hypothetical protein
VRLLGWDIRNRNGDLCHVIILKLMPMALLTVHPEYSRIECELLPVAYDHERLAYEMRKEALPEEFAQTILTGWWTTCLEILPARERALGRF